MSRLQYDQFVDDDEDECCPLCVEEFDLSDRNFRPCPCGYQICQFCYNNIKTTMNGLCPACRRPYDDSTIEFKNITPEEMAKHKQQIAQKAKKNAQIRQKEAQKAEADSLSRKHLAGLRVVQKNLVYVTGLTPTIREDRLLDTLRGPEYFGQYGKIIKIVVSKARENAQHQQSVGVYVTFARKEDAEACITAVDGSQNGDRVLRAQYGTTKYCSAYLRGEQCNNRNCMFLHEPGEDNESFTRQDLSMMNSIQTQQPAQSSTSRSAPPAHPGPPVSAAVTTAAAPMSRQQSNEGSSPTQEAPGLPATAGWASKAALERRASRSTIASHPSPMVQNATPAQASKAPTPAPKKEEPPKVEEPPAPKPKTRKEEKKEERKKEKAKEKAALKSKNASPEPKSPKPKATGFEGLLKTICNSNFKFVFSSAALSEEDFKAIVEFPQLLDPNGGAKRRAMREKEQELLKQRETEAEAKAAAQPQPAAVAEPEESEATAGGSLQLGGEPEGDHQATVSHQNQHAIAPPGQQGFSGNLFGNTSLAEDFSNLGLNNRALTPAQQQQLLLSNFKSGPQSAALLSNLNTQNQQNLGANASGHARHTSRFSFANDSASASANVQPVASQKIMNQQNSMMPKNAAQFNQMPQHQALGGQFFTNVQGPPPGLKPTGTPPVGGTNMFAQGHGFATGGLPYGANAAGRNTNDLYQDLLRNRNIDGGARTADSSKLGSTFTDEEKATLEVDALVNDDEPVRPPLGTPLSGHFFEQPRRSTPSIPPGFTAPAIPRTMAEEAVSLPGSRPGSRPMSRTTSSNIVPAVPVVPVTPAKPETPAKKKGKQSVKTITSVDAAPAASTKAVPATPTKSSTKASGAKAQTAIETSSKAEEAITKNTESKEKKVVPETPAKTPVKGKTANKKTDKVDKPAVAAEDNSQKSSAKESADALVATEIPNATTKRQPPGKLDIPTSKIVEKEPTPTTVPPKAETQTKSVRTIPPTTIPSLPASPAVTAAPSPIKHTAAPRTLRLVSTPKVETPPTVAAPTPPLPQIPTVDKLRSRQASIASLNQPGTPASELVSDTASMTSGMVSRASSPPPVSSIVGSAPVRKITKAQAKKNRQERKRQEEEKEKEEAAADKSDVEVVQAPIIGRKKKTKKPSTTPKPVAAMASAMAAAKSQPASPKSATVEDEPMNTPTVASVKAQSAHNSASATPEPETHPEEASNRREPSAQSILNDLQKTGDLLVSALEFFKPLSSTLTHTSRSTQSGNPTSPPDLKIHFSEADLDALAKKKPVRLGSPDGKSDSRTLITPNGKFFWGLTTDLEERALNLESQIDQLTGYLRYHPSSRSTHHRDAYSPTSDVLPAIATALKEAGKKLPPNSNSPTHLKFDQTGTGYAQHLPPADFPPQPAPPVQQQTPADAGAYLNQFVLPSTDNPPPNHPRPEMAAVGGAPGSGTSSISVQAGAFSKAARAVVEGGAVGSTSLNDLASLARDQSGGVYVRGLEGLVGAGLGMGYIDHGTLGAQGDANVRRVMEGLEAVGVRGASERRSLFSLEEAEAAMHSARREQEVLERKLGALVKRNRKVALGNVR